MICQAVLGNLEDPARIGNVSVDEVELDWTECRRRFLRKRSRQGRDVGLLLPVGTVLRHGDLVFADERVVIAVSVVPCRVIVVPIATPASAAELAYVLGEMHKPIEIAPDGIVSPADDAVAAMLCRLGFRRHTEEVRRFSPLAPASRGWTVGDGIS